MPASFSSPEVSSAALSFISSALSGSMAPGLLLIRSVILADWGSMPAILPSMTDLMTLFSYSVPSAAMVSREAFLICSSASWAGYLSHEDAAHIAGFGYRAPSGSAFRILISLRMGSVLPTINTSPSGNELSSGHFSRYDTAAISRAAKTASAERSISALISLSIHLYISLSHFS